MEWFQNEPERPEVPAHLEESAMSRHGAHVYLVTRLPLMVAPQLRHEAEEYVNRFVAWRERYEAWQKTQPFSHAEAALQIRLFDGPMIKDFGAHAGMIAAYRSLVKLGADEATLRREAALIYELHGMLQALHRRFHEEQRRMQGAADQMRER